MTLIPNLILENIVQVNDMTLLDMSHSKIAENNTATTFTYKVEVFKGAVLESTYTFANDITIDNLFLHIMFTSSGERTVIFTISDDLLETQSVSRLVNVLTEVEDYLYSEDYELLQYEQDIMKYIRVGRSSFKDFHRMAQTEILSFLDRTGVRDSEGNKLVKTSFLDITEVKEWSKFMVLYLIFDSLSNAVDDIFSKKAFKYKALMEEARNRVILSFDENSDSTISLSEKTQSSIRYGKLIR